MNSNLGGFEIEQGKQSEQPDRKQLCIMPTTIRDLTTAVLNTQDDMVEVYGLPFENATIVGVIQEIDHEISKVKMVIDDLTGVINVQVLKKEDELPSFMNKPINVQSWVKARIGIRSFKNTKIYILNQLSPLKSFDEVTLHIGQVTIAKSKFLKGSIPEPQKKPTLQTSKTASISKSPNKQQSIKPGQDIDSEQLHIKVLNAIKLLNQKNNKGASKQEIYDLFRSKMDMPKLENNLDVLMNEFMIINDGSGLFVPL